MGRASTHPESGRIAAANLLRRLVLDFLQADPFRCPVVAADPLRAHQSALRIGPRAAAFELLHPVAHVALCDLDHHVPRRV